MIRFLMFGIFLLIPSVFASGQNQPTDYNKVEVFAGYSNGSGLFENLDGIQDVEHGFNVAAVYNFHRYFGVKVDASGTYKVFNNSPFFRTKHSLYNVTAGIQIKNNKRTGRFKPFAHVMAGFAKHSDRTTAPCPVGITCPPIDFDFDGFAMVAGGGLDIRVNRRIDIRAVQIDLNPIGVDSIYLNTRFSTGIVFKF
jgi:hypothetical protein